MWWNVGHARFSGLVCDDALVARRRVVALPGSPGGIGEVCGPAPGSVKNGQVSAVKLLGSARGKFSYSK